MAPAASARWLALGHARAFELATKVENQDGTYDLLGVEILSVGGPIHGVGSPPEGDYWTLDELRAMADADAELGDEIKPPNKLGHPDEQVLVRNSIRAGELPTDGEMPAVGWVENLRVEGTKLLADVKKVPKLVMEALEVGAYRTRSVELSKVTSQRTGKSYDWVVTGLAWLGGKMPAVKTLGDVVALYEGDVPIRRRFVVEYAAGDVVWTPSEGLEYVRGEINRALNPVPPGGPDLEAPSRYWVRDVAEGKALVEDWAEAGVAYVVPFSIVDGRAVPAQSSDWVRAEEGWLEVGRQNEERALTLRASRADTGTMKFKPEQRRKFAEATGIAEADVTDRMLEAAGVQAEGEGGGGQGPAPAPAAPNPDDREPGQPAPQDDSERRDGPGSTDTGTAGERALESRVVSLETELHQERRRAFVDELVGAHKISPGERPKWEKLYTRDPELAREMANDLQERDDLGELGDDGEDGRDFEQIAGRSYEDDAADRLGLSKEAIV